MVETSNEDPSLQFESEAQFYCEFAIALDGFLQLPGIIRKASDWASSRVSFKFDPAHFQDHQ